ncbi:MAG: 3'(2'),5'-bisphosphate nucleotidase CysQ [Hyphomicrobiales bacterium]
MGSDIAETGLLDGLTLIASRAAAAIMAVPRTDLNKREKADRSPVTAADQASEAIILEGLARLMPGVTVISEEATGSRPVTASGGLVVIVDPLDGTREFLAGLDEFVVNIALVDDGTPIAGVVAAPARGLIWRGHAGRGAERLALPPGASLDTANNRVAIHARPRPASGARVLISRSHLDPATDAYVDRLTKPEKIACGSALKFCLLADGTADLYPRLGPTSEWDIAAGHAVLLAAGGDVRKPDGSALRYGLGYREGNYLIPSFIAAGDCQA